MRKVIDSYSIDSNRVQAEVKIWEMPTDNIPLYDIIFPEISPATNALLDELAKELSETVPTEWEQGLDINKLQQAQDEYWAKIYQLLKKKLLHSPEKTIASLANVLLNRLYGFGMIDLILADDYIEELTINGSNYPLSVYHKKYGWLKTNKFLSSEEEIQNLVSRIGRKVNREINMLHPIMDAHLLSGDRVSSTMYPISTIGSTLTIRRFSRDPWTPTKLIDPQYGSTSPSIMAFLWQAIQYELNIIVVGGTASGKTSMLNSLCAFLPQNQRIISIEDTREVQLPRTLNWNWVPLVARLANQEKEGEVSMLNLLVSSLRMRPDRIIVGEVRKREQMEAMFEAMHTGHSTYSTMHADSAQQAKRRLLEPPIKIPKMELGSLHLILAQFRDRKSGKRRTLELAEVLSPAYENQDLELNHLYRWHPRNDTFEKVNESVRVAEELSVHTGMSPQEMNEDLEEKELVLRWMVQEKIFDLNRFGEIMSYYYKFTLELLQAIKTNKNFSEIKELFASHSSVEISPFQVKSSAQDFDDSAASKKSNSENDERDRPHLISRLSSKLKNRLGQVKRSSKNA